MEARIQRPYNRFPAQVKKFCSKFIANKVLRSFLIIACFAFYCEILHYFVVVLRCAWPLSQTDNFDKYSAAKNDLRAMFLADTHLLGFTEGHWFDKLRREWQMKQAFQTAIWIHKPDIVFVLGDLFDEGKWCDDEEFFYHASRFRSMFAVPQGTDLYAVAGNHDEGFHYMMTGHKHKRFQDEFRSPSVHLVTKKDVKFVLLNSMAMEGDGCRICAKAEIDLRNISKYLTTLKNCQDEQKVSEICFKYSEQSSYSQPILLQHFPMYRRSDADCHTEDSAPETSKYDLFREKYDCLDQRSTNLVSSAANSAKASSDSHRPHSSWMLQDAARRDSRMDSFILQLEKQKQSHIPHGQTFQQ